MFIYYRNSHKVKRCDFLIQMTSRGHKGQIRGGSLSQNELYGI